MTGSSPRRAARGFTLIELLVVMLIIGTLLSIAVPRYFRTLAHPRETVLRQDLAILRQSIDKYYADRGAYPDTLVALADKPYVPSIPADPSTKEANPCTLAEPAGPHAPHALQDLVQDERLPVPKHHLRRLYPDPVTGKADWSLIPTPSGQAIMGVASSSQGVPIKRDGFDTLDNALKGADCYCAW